MKRLQAAESEGRRVAEESQRLEVELRKLRARYQVRTREGGVRQRLRGLRGGFLEGFFKCIRTEVEIPKHAVRAIRGGVRRTRTEAGKSLNQEAQSMYKERRTLILPSRILGLEMCGLVNRYIFFQSCAVFHPPLPKAGSCSFSDGMILSTNVQTPIG